MNCKFYEFGESFIPNMLSEPGSEYLNNLILWIVFISVLAFSP